jgi:hypothetical protein
MLHMAHCALAGILMVKVQPSINKKINTIFFIAKYTETCLSSNGLNNTYDLEVIVR